MMGANIINRGRGPEIEGTRITVYDVMDYLEEGWRYDQIAGLFRLPPDDIQAAIEYIETHKEDVVAAYQEILARHCNIEYSPEVQQKLGQNRQKLQAKLTELHARPKAWDTPAEVRRRFERSKFNKFSRLDRRTICGTQY